MRHGRRQCVTAPSSNRAKSQHHPPLEPPQSWRTPLNLKSVGTTASSCIVPFLWVHIPLPPAGHISHLVAHLAARMATHSHSSTPLLLPATAAVTLPFACSPCPVHTEPYLPSLRHPFAQPLLPPFVLPITFPSLIRLAHFIYVRRPAQLYIQRTLRTHHKPTSIHSRYTQIIVRSTHFPTAFATRSRFDHRPTHLAS